MIQAHARKVRITSRKTAKGADEEHRAEGWSNLEDTTSRAGIQAYAPRAVLFANAV